MKKILTINILIAVLIFSNTVFSFEGDNTLSAKGSDYFVDSVLESVSGHQVRFSEYKANSPVLLFFFTTWSKKCIDQIDTYRALNEKWHEKGLKIIAINNDKNDRLLSPFVKKYRIPFLVLKDGKGDFQKAYSVGFYPTNILIDKEGAIVYRDIKVPEDVDIRGIL